MHRQLQVIADEFTTAQQRVHRLREVVPQNRWRERMDSNRWSIAECVAHLNLTSRNFEPLVREALDRGRHIGGAAPRRYRRNLVGWLLWRSSGPPVRLRIKTPPPFVPTSTAPPEELVAEFDRFQAEQLSWVDKADGLPLSRLWVTSPFDGRIRYNLYACLSILPRHQHRHVWQAEQVWQRLQAGGA